jgi:hypothetical protein
MAELLTLTAPLVPPTRTTYKINRLVLDVVASVIQAYLGGSDGVEVLAEWTGAPAAALLTALNSANLSVKSLQRRVLEQAVTDGKLTAGTVSGTPS